MLHAVNVSAGLYVIRCGDGYTCLGFEVAYRKAHAVATWCGAPLPHEEWIGTEEGYNEYAALMVAGLRHHEQAGTRCPADLTPALVGSTSGSRAAGCPCTWRSPGAVPSAAPPCTSRPAPRCASSASASERRGRRFYRRNAAGRSQARPDSKVFP
jgi:hypothetical protein